MSKWGYLSRQNRLIRVYLSTWMGWSVLSCKSIVPVVFKIHWTFWSIKIVLILSIFSLHFHVHVVISSSILSCSYRSINFNNWTMYSWVRLHSNTCKSHDLSVSVIASMIVHKKLILASCIDHWRLQRPMQIYPVIQIVKFPTRGNNKLDLVFNGIPECI